MYQHPCVLSRLAGCSLPVTDGLADRKLPQANTHRDAQKQRHTQERKSYFWTKLRVKDKFSGAVVKYFTDHPRHIHTHEHVHAYTPAASIRWCTTSITLQRQGAHQVSWKVVRVHSNGSCRHRTVETFKEETPSCTDLLTSQHSSSKSGSFHVFCLNNSCMVNQTQKHMLFFMSLYTSNMSILHPILHFSFTQSVHWTELNITSFSIWKLIFLILSVAPLTAPSTAQAPPSIRWLLLHEAASAGLLQSALLESARVNACVGKIVCIKT